MLLKRIIPSPIKKMVRFIIKYVCKLYNLYRNALYSKEYRLIKNPDEVFKIAYHVADETWNTMYTPELFNIAKERTIVAKYPSLNFYSIPNATINQDSDIVLTEHGAWWDKYNDEDFITLAQPCDCNLVRYDSESITVMPAKRKEFISGKVLSLTGVWSYAWSHCLFQFICKLFCAGESGLLNQRITLLTNDYKDENIEYILRNYLKKYKHVNRVITNNNIDYTCEELICIRSMTYNYNEAKVYWDYRLITPQIVVDKLQQYVSKPIINEIKDNITKYKKIYLSRHSNRKLVNTDEVERFFREEGFYFIEGAELSLEEKVDIFYHADIIVGPHSSAWQNIIFCNNVKCLMFSNNRYSTEMVFYTMAKQNVKYWLNVCGQDETSERRSDYYIPLEKIKLAYNQLLDNDK